MEPHYTRGVPPAPYPYRPASDEAHNKSVPTSQTPFTQQFLAARAIIPGNDNPHGKANSLSPTWLGNGHDFVQSDPRFRHPSTPEFADQTISQQPTPPGQPEDRLSELREWLVQNNGLRLMGTDPSDFPTLQPNPGSGHTMPLSPHGMVHLGWPGRFNAAPQYPPFHYNFDGHQGVPQQYFRMVDPSRPMHQIIAQQQTLAPTFQQRSTSGLMQPSNPGSHMVSRPRPVGPSPGQAHVDKKTLRQQAQYARKGERARQQALKRQAEQAAKDLKRAERIKRPRQHELSTGSAQQFQQSQQPPFMQYNGAVAGLGQQLNLNSAFAGLPSQQSFQPINSGPTCQNLQATNQASEGTVSMQKRYRFTPTPTSPIEATPPEPIEPNPDDLPQAITVNYEDYKWSVKLYGVTATAVYDFAQSFLEDVFETHNLYDTGTYKWHAHTTLGFIQGGSRLSFIVLHNAANPFSWGMVPESTTSIGVYGRSTTGYKEIHWKTFAPDIRALLHEYMDKRYFCEKGTWTSDMKPTERRFHRAYWHAAKMLPLRALLNHAEDDEVPHDAMEEDDEMVVENEDLQYEWEGAQPDEKRAEEAWREVLKMSEEMDDDENRLWEHVETGCSEWDQFGM